MAAGRIVSSPGIQIGEAIRGSAPDDHFTACPHRCVIGSGSGRVVWGGRYPTIRTGIVSAAAIQRVGILIKSAPCDHFAAGPHGCVDYSRARRVSRARGCPSVCAGIVSAAAVQVLIATVVQSPAPYDHFLASPYRLE